MVWGSRSGRSGVEVGAVTKRSRVEVPGGRSDRTTARERAFERLLANLHRRAGSVLVRVFVLRVGRTILEMAKGKRWVTAVEGALGAGLAGLSVLVDVDGVPRWAVALTVVGLTVLVGAVTQAIIGPKNQRVGALAVSTLAATGLFAGTWIFEAAQGGGPPPFVNYVPNEFLMLSPEPGAPARTGATDLGLTVDHEQSAYCYVVVNEQVWLDFDEGWAPLDKVHIPAGFPEQLPAHCS